MSTLNDMQEAFCIAYVTNGGHAQNAAAEAGYAHPHVTGSRLLANKKVSARIAELVSLNITSRLGELVQATWSMAMAPETPPRERLGALLALMDRAGLTVPKQSASVAVQVNVGAGETDARAVSDTIRDIEALRAARLGIAGSC